MACNLEPASDLLHPYAREAKMGSLSGIWHLSGPYDRLAASHDGRVPVDMNILDLPVIRREGKHSGLGKSNDLLLAEKLVKGVRESENRHNASFLSEMNRCRTFRFGCALIIQRT